MRRLRGCIVFASARPLALRVEQLETPARGGKPRPELLLERLDFAAEPEHRVVEPPRVVAPVRAGGARFDGCAAAVARHVGWRRKREHPSTTLEGGRRFHQPPSGVSGVGRCAGGYGTELLEQPECVE